MPVHVSPKSRHAVVGALVAVGMLIPVGASSSTGYGYDQLGQLRSALYDNGACVTYSYDAAGNRTSQETTVSDTPEDATWGSGYWGCFAWTAP